MINVDAKVAENITMTRSWSICVSRSNIRDWLLRQIIYFQPNFEDPGQDHDAMAGLHPASHAASLTCFCITNVINVNERKAS